MTFQSWTQHFLLSNILELQTCFGWATHSPSKSEKFSGNQCLKFQVSDVKNQGIKCTYTDDDFTQGWDLNPFTENVLCVLSLSSAGCVLAS